MTWTRLKFSTTITAGQSPASSDVHELTDGIPFLQGKGEFGTAHPSPRYQCALANKECEPGDILVSVRAPVGSVNVADQCYGIGRGLAAVRAIDVYPGFLRWVMEEAASFLHAESTGSTFEAVTAWDIGEIRYPGHSADSQRAISDHLDHETGKIDAILSKIDEVATALRQRGSQTAVILGLEDDQSAHDDSRSPIAGIPAHWQRTKFGYDFTESTERNGDSLPGPLLSISEYRGVELNTRTDGQQASLDASKYRVVRPGQLAANMMWLNHGGLGVSSLTGYVSPDYKAFWISERFEPRYIHHLFRSSRYIGYFSAIATGVRPNAQRVTKTVLDATPVPLPPLEEQVRIADHLDQVTDKIDAMLTKVADLKALLLERRGALITDVLTGRKDAA
ncbi:MAG: restriction endonuclease subunit S [Rhodoglobus sp.]